MATSFPPKLAIRLMIWVVLPLMKYFWKSLMTMIKVCWSIMRDG